MPDGKDPSFLDGLDYKKRAMYRALPEDRRRVIDALPGLKQKKRMIALWSYELRGTSARQKWINGLRHMDALCRNPDHFVHLLMAADRQGVDDLVDLYLNFEQGEYDGERNTDPSVHALLSEGVRIFKARNYHRVDYEPVLDFSERRRSLGVTLDVSGDLVDLGLSIRAIRLNAGFTQRRLAGECGISEKTLKNVEKGSPSSVAVLFKILRRLGVLDCVLDGVRPSLDPSRRRARKAVGGDRVQGDRE